MAQTEKKDMEVVNIKKQDGMLVMVKMVQMVQMEEMGNMVKMGNLQDLYLLSLKKLLTNKI